MDSIIDLAAQWARIFIYSAHFRYLGYAINIILDVLGAKKRESKVDLLMVGYDSDLNILINRQDHIGKTIFYHGYYEGREIRIVKKLLRADDIILDIGANIGSWTLIFGKLAPAGKVYAFEPSNTFIQLQKNLSLNPRLTRIDTFNIALGNENGFGEIDQTYGETSNDGMKRMVTPPLLTSMANIPMTTLDAWSSKHALHKLDWIKIDTEGMEYQIILGGKQVISRFKPKILLEVNEALLNFYGNSVKQLNELLSSLGYCHFYVSSRGIAATPLSKISLLDIRLPCNVICSSNAINR
jgi:FkbM family methyltransferase